MKKTFKMVGMACLVGAFAFLGSSCKKNNTDTTSIKVTLPAVEEMNIGEERAYINWEDGRHMMWSRDDMFMFYNLNSDYTKSIRNIYTLYEGADTQTAHFSGGVMGDEQDLGYFCFYPAQKVMDHPIGPRNSQTFDVPAEQHYNPRTMDPTSLVMAVKGKAPSDDFTFLQIFGFLKVRIQAEAGRDRVEWVSVTDKSFNLTGDITVDIPAVDPGTLEELIGRCANPNVAWNDYMTQLNTYLHEMNYSSNPTGKTVTLICDEPVQLGPDPNDPNNPYTDFFITLRPGALANGFVVTVKYEGVDEPVVYDQYDPESSHWYLNLPTQVDAYGNYLYPRKFCIRPSYSIGARIN